jgi:regulator of replication initiation timing
VLITVGWTVWRLLANLKSLMASMNEMSQKLAPTLEELATKSQETAELTERLQQRQALRQRGGGGGRRR